MNSKLMKNNPRNTIGLFITNQRAKEHTIKIFGLIISVHHNRDTNLVNIIYIEATLTYNCSPLSIGVQTVKHCSVWHLISFHIYSLTNIDIHFYLIKIQAQIYS